MRVLLGAAGGEHVAPRSAAAEQPHGLAQVGPPARRSAARRAPASTPRRSAAGASKPVVRSPTYVAVDVAARRPRGAAGRGRAPGRCRAAGCRCRRGRARRSGCAAGRRRRALARGSGAGQVLHDRRHRLGEVAADEHGARRRRRGRDSGNGSPRSSPKARLPPAAADAHAEPAVVVDLRWCRARRGRTCRAGRPSRWSARRRRRRRRRPAPCSARAAREARRGRGRAPRPRTPRAAGRAAPSRTQRGREALGVSRAARRTSSPSGTARRGWPGTPRTAPAADRASGSCAHCRAQYGQCVGTPVTRPRTPRAGRWPPPGRAAGRRRS